MIETPPPRNPYVGPVPFGRGDSESFFGRDGEVPELVSLVVSHRVVVLHATSGAGKTSLVDAALVPHLRDDEGFDVLPTARVRAALPAWYLSSNGDNAYTVGVLLNWGVDLDDEADPEPAAEHPRSIEGFLDARARVVGPDGLPRPRAVVFDQFEEVFTTQPEHWEDREPFFRELAGVVDQDPYLRLVLVIREDYLGNLEPFSSLFPGELGYRFRLERLTSEAAVDAVECPLRGSTRSFGRGVAEKLVEDLRTSRYIDDRHASHVLVGEFIEPVQLQVVCHRLWERLPPETTEITEEHVRTVGDVDEVLGEFYDSCVSAAIVASGSDEPAVRRAIETAFITSGGTRATVYRSTETTGGISNAAIDELERMHLLRPEWRANGRWYELTHDRLIDPIRSSNRRHAARIARRRRAQQGVLAAVGLLLIGALLGGVLSRQGSSSSTSPHFGVTPSALTFNTTVVGANSEPKRVTVTAGNDPATIAAIRTTSLDFGRSRDCIRRISAGHKCVVQVVFAPHKPGPDNATLVLVMGDGSEQRIEMNGVGVNNDVTIRPHHVRFGVVPTNTRSSIHAVVVRNAGATDVPLDIGGYADFGRPHPLGFVIQDQDCPSVLPPKGKCTVLVWFHPTSRGPATTVAVILVGMDPLAFTVSGVGGPPPHTAS